MKKSNTKEMNVDELIKEYERNLSIKLTEREREIFNYAYFIGINKLNKIEEEK